VEEDVLRINHLDVRVICSLARDNLLEDEAHIALVKPLEVRKDLLLLHETEQHEVYREVVQSVVGAYLLVPELQDNS
jgi:hypothetical protein